MVVKSFISNVRLKLSVPLDCYCSEIAILSLIGFLVFAVS